MYDESFIHLEKKILIDFYQQRIPIWYILHALICDAYKTVSVPQAPWQDEKSGGSLSRENLDITTKDFAKSRGEGNAQCSFPSRIKHTLLSIYTFAVDQYFRLHLEAKINMCASSSRRKR